MDFTQYVLLGAVIAGSNELLVRLRARDYWVVATIVTAAAIGAGFGAAHYMGLDIVEGIAAGLGTSGAIKTLSAFGNKSTPAPSSVLEKSK